MRSILGQQRPPVVCGGCAEGRSAPHTRCHTQMRDVPSALGDLKYSVYGAVVKWKVKPVSEDIIPPPISIIISLLDII